MSFAQDFRNTFARGGNGAIKLIVVNAAVFLILNILVAFARNGGGSGEAELRWVAMPSAPPDFLHHPWTIITYMFSHYELGHVFFNMVMLFVMARIFTEYLDSKRLVNVYVLGGISGGLFYFAAYNLFPQLGYGLLLGASAGVMAITVTIAYIAPNYPVGIPFLGAFPLKYFALVVFLLTSVVDLSSNTGGKVAHIGGAAFGLIYGMQHRKGRDLGRGFGRFLDSIASLFRPGSKPKMRVSYRRGPSDEQYNESKVQKQKKIDEILDKISKSGYESLSKEEKDLLFKMSNDKK